MSEGVLLINLGTPDEPGPGAVGTYLSEFLNDRRVIDINPVGRFFLVNAIIIPFRRFKSSKLYQRIWTKNGSPLLIHSVKLKEELAAKMPNVQVELAMRYRQPSIADALKRLQKNGVSKITVLPLYPQYASSSTGSSIEEVLRIVKKWEIIPSLNIISSFFEHPAFIEALTVQANKFNINDYDHVLFSYHGLPERQIRKGSDEFGNHPCQLGDCCKVITPHNRYCYRAGCFATTRALVKALQIPEGKYTSAFQSRLDNAWLKPYSDKVIQELAEQGKKKVLVFSPAFVADCLETIHEIGVEYDEIFKEHGGEKVTLVPSLNADPVWVNAVHALVTGR